MSGTGTSPLASSTEKTNGAKLSRLLIDGGTTVLRSVFDSYHPPAHLVPDLNANKPKLVSLLRKKVLNNSQWEKLFPAPGRAAPDSNTFDITLLFLLLTNICGLSPPLTGWHSKPPQSDISHEANLARVKFFRNKLYGHVATTGVDTATFNALWLEISGVLVALGLGQAEIDRLKVEHSGEEDYLDALRDWAESEEDIKSQLRDISQSQITTQQIVGENKSKLEELHQSERETRQVLTEVLQGQQEDHGRIQQSISQLGLIHQTEIEIDHTVQELNQMYREDRKTLQDTKRKVEKLSEAHFEASQTVSKVLKTQEEHLETLQRTFEDAKGRQGDNQDQILKKLAKVDPQNDVKYYAERHLEGTRESIFAKVKSWLDDRNSPNRVMVISANPGMGKSVVAAVICKRMQVAGRLLGSHFCRHDKARHRNPKVMLQSLAYHLSSCLPEYKKALVEQLSRNLGVEINNMEIGELFELLLEEPLSRHPDPGFTYLVVIDALDESEYQGRNELVDVVGKYFSKLPLWVRFLVTTRPEINISESLRELQPLHLQPNSEDNLKDIRLYLQQRLSDVLPAQSREMILNGLVEKSEGVILCAQFLVDSIKNDFSTRSLEFEQFDSTLPKGISVFYNSYFKRLETELCKELKITEDHFFGFLSAITAAREPLPLGFVSKLLFSGKSSPALQRNVRNAIGCISSLLPIQDERIHFFHKSVKDWLTGKSNYGQHSFSVEEGEGHCILSRLCIEEYDDIKTRGVVSSQQFSDAAKYSLKHGVEHMLQVDECARSCNLEELANRYVIDIELVYAKLCVSSVTAFQDVFFLTKQQEWDALSVLTQSSLETFLCILREHRTCLEEHPSTVFQMVLNEGGPQLSSEASELLGNKYSDILYMEYLDKRDLQGAVETEFHCSSEVACVDVSPQSEYMVCECIDGTIQLWSLLSGKLMWKRGVIKKKRYYPRCQAFRMVKLGPDLRRLPYPAWSMSYFRSVVFHPNKEFILPGVLSHAYLFNGELISLFPESNCSFSTCSMSGDRIITDCPDDAKCFFMWSLEDGTEITRVSQEEDVLSFSWSTDRRLLAVSHCSGSICVLDAMNGFRTLIKTSTPDVCGMIKFSPDRRFLFCWPLITYMNDEDSRYVYVESGVNTFLDLHLSLGDRENVSLVPVSLHNGDFKPWEFESHSEGGFVLGDPFCRYPVGSYHPLIAFVLNKQSVLTSSPDLDLITILSIDKLRNGGFVSLFFSFNGETLYTIENSGTGISISCWDVSSGDLKVLRRIAGYFVYFVPVRDGLLLKRGNRPTLELWNLELFHCIRQWDSITSKPIPISDQHVYVACQGSEQAIILDTSTDDTITTISPFLGRLVALSSRWQLITFNDGRLLSIQNPIWEVCWPIPGRQVITLEGIFSPAEQFLVIYGKVVGHQNLEDVVDVVDALSGNTLHTLRVASDVKGCKFVSDEECAILSYDSPGGLYLQLFNVRSGEPISVMDFKRNRQEFPSLASCLRKGLIAIAPLANEKFKVIQVKLPRKSKDSSKRNRIKYQQ